METHGVTVRSRRTLRGPNLYAYMPVLQVVIDIGPYEEQSSHSFPGFVDRLTAWLPGLQKHECSVGKPGGFIERLQRGTYLGHICEHWLSQSLKMQLVSIPSWPNRLSCAPAKSWLFRLLTGARMAAEYEVFEDHFRLFLTKELKFIEPQFEASKR